MDRAARQRQTLMAYVQRQTLMAYAQRQTLVAYIRDRRSWPTC